MKIYITTFLLTLGIGLISGGIVTKSFTLSVLGGVMIGMYNCLISIYGKR